MSNIDSIADFVNPNRTQIYSVFLHSFHSISNEYTDYLIEYGYSWSELESYLIDDIEAGHNARILISPEIPPEIISDLLDYIVTWAREYSEERGRNIGVNIVAYESTKLKELTLKYNEREFFSKYNKEELCYLLTMIKQEIKGV